MCQIPNRNQPVQIMYVLPSMFILMSTLEDIPIWPICTFFLAGFHCLKPSHSVEVLVFSRTFDGKLLKLGSNIKKCSNQSPSFIFHHCSMEYDLNDFYKRNIEKLFLRGNRYPNWQRTYPLAASMIFLFPLRGIWTRSPGLEEDL